MTVIHRNNLARERAVMVLNDITGVPLHVIIKRDDDELFSGGIKNKDAIHDMIDRKMFDHIVMKECWCTDEPESIDATWDLLNESKRYQQYN